MGFLMTRVHKWVFSNLRVKTGFLTRVQKTGSFPNPSKRCAATTFAPSQMKMTKIP